MELVVFQLLILIFSVVIHEVAHGYVAESLGDPTARLSGRLTLNPIRHLDPMGSVALPLLFYFLSGGAMMFGWAKPVPYNPANLRDPIRGGAKIAAAGPLANFLIAVAFALALRVLGGAPSAELLGELFAAVVYLNILLAVFNLVPIPPLDGSKVLLAFLPKTEQAFRAMAFLEQNGFLLILLFVFFGFQLISPIIQFVFHLLVGS